MHQSLRFKIYLLAFSLITMCSAQMSFGLDFNQIQLHSYLDQPLNVHFMITEYADESIQNYQVRLSDPSEFQKQNVPYSLNLQQLQLKLIRNQQAPYLSVTSMRPIIQSQLSFLITLTNQRTQTVDIYKVNLNIKRAPLNMRLKKHYFSMGNESHSLSYGPTQIGDNLLQISKEMRPSVSVNVDQMMLAIMKRNPRAFNKQNSNGLQAGRILIMPSIKMIQSIPAGFAIQEILRQNKVWQNLA